MHREWIVGVVLGVLLVASASGQTLHLGIVLEESEVHCLYPVCGYIELSNHGFEPFSVESGLDLYLPGVELSIEGPVGDPVVISGSNLSRYMAPGEELWEVEPGGAMRMPFFLLKSGGSYILSRPGKYELRYSNEALGMSASASVCVTLVLNNS